MCWTTHKNILIFIALSDKIACCLSMLRKSSEIIFNLFLKERKIARYHRQTKQAPRKFYKVNHHIQAEKVRLVVDDENLGIFPLIEAIFKARQKGLDLVQISEKVDPPICKAIDFRKFVYKEQKKDQAGRKKGKTQDTKEIRFTPFIGKADLESRVKKVQGFLEDGDKVKLTVKFTGRQITRKDFGNRVIKSVLEMLEGTYKIETEPRLQGKMLFMIIKPNKK